MTNLMKLTIIICSCLHNIFASHHDSHSHTIPVEGYETQLQVLGQHVEYPEPPVKIIKITKTVAVKVPVPYPVKVVEKIPYPVHVSKPYPVPVPQIVKVPFPVEQKHGAPASQPHYPLGAHEEPYQVQENAGDEHHPTSDGGEHNFNPLSGGYPESGDGGHKHRSEAPTGYEAATSYSNSDDASFESKSYDQAINEYLNKHKKY